MFIHKKLKKTKIITKTYWILTNKITNMLNHMSNKRNASCVLICWVTPFNLQMLQIRRPLKVFFLELVEGLFDFNSNLQYVSICHDAAVLSLRLVVVLGFIMISPLAHILHNNRLTFNKFSLDASASASSVCQPSWGSHLVARGWWPPRGRPQSSSRPVWKNLLLIQILMFLAHYRYLALLSSYPIPAGGGYIAYTWS